MSSTEEKPAVAEAEKKEETKGEEEKGEEKKVEKTEENKEEEKKDESASGEEDGEGLNVDKDEDILFQKRAKLWRFDHEEKAWKERGTGDVKLLQHKDSQKIRVLMRRERTLKVCANHYVLPCMELKPNAGSDRSWVYQCPADLSDDEPKSESFALRFGKPEIAKEWETAFNGKLPLLVRYWVRGKASMGGCG